MTSFHIFCFYKLFLTSICEKRKSSDNFLAEYEANLCKLSNKEEDQFQKEIKNISKNILNFDEFFKYLGLPIREQSELTKMLKWAIKNSEKKGYHSALDVMKFEESLSSDKKKQKEKLELAAKMSSGE